MKLETALKKFLVVIERDAACGHTERDYENSCWVWNEEVWKRNDPEYYKHWKRLADMIGGVPLSQARE